MVSAGPLCMAVVVETRTTFHRKRHAALPVATQVHNTAYDIEINYTGGGGIISEKSVDTPVWAALVVKLG